MSTDHLAYDEVFLYPKQRTAFVSSMNYNHQNSVCTLECLPKQIPVGSLISRKSMGFQPPSQFSALCGASASSPLVGNVGSICTGVYQPLHQDTSIRLITIDILQPKESPNSLFESPPIPIYCQLVNVDLSANPAYYAVSYEWRYEWAFSITQLPLKMIYMNGRPLYVMDNLYHALVHFGRRHVPGLNEDLPRYFWIDALCINQHDTKERNHQVELMGRIYSEAIKVLVWLGLPKRGLIDKEMIVLQKLSELEPESETEMMLASYYADLYHHLRAISGSESARAFETEWLQRIKDWGNKSYWHRMWITQEIQLAKDLHIYSGDLHMAWSSLNKAREWFVKRSNENCNNHQAYRNVCVSAAFRLDKYRERRFKSTLREWMALCYNSRCAEPRDKIYALLSLADETRGRLRADYSKSFSQIYCDVMALYSPYKALGYEDLDCGIAALSELLQNMLNSNDRNAVALENENSDHIWICGFFVGPVVQVNDEIGSWASIIHSISTEIFDAAFRSYAKNGFPLRKASRSFADGLPPTGEFIWLPDQDPSSQIPPVYAAADTQMPMLFHLDWPQHSLLKSGDHTELESNWDKMLRVAGSTNWDCEARVDIGLGFLPQNERISGVAPYGTQVGDLICCFPGIQGVLVLRRELDSWRLKISPYWRRLGNFRIGDFSSLTDDDKKKFWNGNPSNPCSLENTPEGAIYLRLNLSTLQQLTKPT